MTESAVYPTNPQQRPLLFPPPLAEYAAEVLEADLYEIVPEDPYTEADLTYDTDGRADKEQSDPSARSVITGSTLDMSQYDVIVLGYPYME